MPHPYWPLFDLVVRTPRLTIRYLDDECGVALAALAGRGIHDPGYMPFAMPWSDAQSPDLERDALRFYWRCRAETVPDKWSLQFATFEGDVLVGSTNLLASGFPVKRTFETGSWLGREYQGQGIGTEMRIATLHIGFVALDAVAATTGAFFDNAPSLGVTRKLGYEPNGVDLHERRGEAAEIRRFRMTRSQFFEHVHCDDVEIDGDEPVRELLGVVRGEAIDA
jgi:RimJ/RimL family protein N-acetyltransferase